MRGLHRVNKYLILFIFYWRCDLEVCFFFKFKFFPLTLKGTQWGSYYDYDIAGENLIGKCDTKRVPGTTIRSECGVDRLQQLMYPYKKGRMNNEKSPRYLHVKDRKWVLMAVSTCKLIKQPQESRLLRLFTLTSLPARQLMLGEKRWGVCERRACLGQDFS